MSKSLIIYYSWSGNTKVIVDYIEELTCADIFEIKPVKPYSTNYSTCLNEAKNDLNTNARPELEEYLSNVDEYDTIYVGYPNWWGTIPMPILTQLEKLDLNRKIIKPFVTSGGTGIGSSKRDIEKSSKGAKVEEGLSIRSSSINSAKNTVKEWI